MPDKRRDDELKKLLADIATAVATEVLIEVGPIVVEEAGNQGRRFADRLRQRRRDMAKAAQTAGVRVSRRLQALPWPSRGRNEGGEEVADTATSLHDLHEQLNKRLDTIEAKVDELRQNKTGLPSG